MILPDIAPKYKRELLKDTNFIKSEYALNLDKKFEYKTIDSGSLSGRPVDNEKIDIDPAQALSRLKQADADWKITNQTLTPFNAGKLIQSFSIVHNNQLFMITVKHVTQNIFQYQEQQNEETRYMQCSTCNSVLQPSRAKQKDNQITRDRCDYDSSHLLDFTTDAAFFECLQCKETEATEYAEIETTCYFKKTKSEVFKEEVIKQKSKEQNQIHEVCAQCYTNNFVRQGLKQKTFFHSYKKDYEFVETSKDLQQKVVVHATGTRKKNTLSIVKKNLIGTSQLSQYQSSDNQTNYALIGIWLQKDKKEKKKIEYQCKFELTIDNPKTLNNDKSGVEMQKFLHISDDEKQLFYFTSDKSEMQFHLLNIEDLVNNCYLKIHESVKLNREVSEKFFQTEKNLLLINGNLVKVDKNLTLLNMDTLIISEPFVQKYNQLAIVKQPDLDSIWLLCSDKTGSMLKKFDRNFQLKEEFLFEQKQVELKEEFLFEQKQVDNPFQVYLHFPKIIIITKIIISKKKESIKPDQQWQLFQIYGDKINLIFCSVKNQVKLQHPQFVSDQSQGYVVGQLEHHDHKNEFTKIRIDLVQSEKDVLNQIAKQTEKIKFDYSECLKKHQHYFVMPWRLFNEQFYSQLMYQDSNSGQTNALFLMWKPATQLPAWSLPSLDEFIVEYPVLIYKPPNQIQNKLMLVNLVKNTPQMQLNLKDKKGEIYFISFVEAGPIVGQSKPEQCVIYFLGMKSDGQINLFQFKIKVWEDVEKDEIDLICFDNFLINFSGYNQIKKCQLIRNFHLKETFVLLIQTTQNILFFTSDSKCQNKKIKMQDDKKMVPIFMIRGQQNICYYVTTTPTNGDELHCIYYVESSNEVKTNCVYQTKNRILQVHYDHGVLPAKNVRQKQNNQLVLVDDQLQMYILSDCELIDNQIKTNLDVLQNIDMQEHQSKRIFRAFESIPWQKGSNTAIALLGTKQKTRGDTFEEQITTRRLTIYSVRIGNYFNFEFLGFGGKDEKVKRIAIETEHIRFIGKYITTYLEGSFSYFLTSQDETTQRIDLMSYFQQKALQCNIHTLREVIVMACEKFYLVFDQSNLMFIGTERKKFGREIESCYEHQVVKIDNQYSQFVRKNKKFEKLFSHEDITTEPETNFAPTTDNVHFQQNNVKEQFQIIFGDSDLKFKELQIIFYGAKPSILIEIYKDNNKEDDDDDKKIHLLQVHSQIKNKEINLYYLYKDGAKIQQSFNFTETLEFIVIFKPTSKFIYFVEKQKIKLFDQIQKKEDFQIEMKRIPIQDLFDSAITYQPGFRLFQVSENNANIVMCTEKKKQKVNLNLIQISFKERSIIWDLHSNSEVTTLYDISDFDNYNNFVVTGFKIHSIQPGQKMDECIFLQSNDNYTYISCEETEERLSFLSRLYMPGELKQLIATQNALESGKPVDNTSLIFVTANVCGDTYFSTFYRVADLFNKVYKQLDNENQVYDEKYRISIRKIFYSLCLPYCHLPQHSAQKKVEGRFIEIYENQNDNSNDSTFMSVLYQRQIFNGDDKSTKRIQKEKQINRHTLIQWLIVNNNPLVFEILLKILLLSKEVTLRSLIQTFQDFINVFNVQSELINEFMVKAFIETPMSKRVTQIKLSSSLKIVAFPSNTAQLCQSEILRGIQDQIWEKNSFLEKIYKSIDPESQDITERFRPVQVRIIEIGWLQKMFKFYKYISRQPSGLFENELIKLILLQQDYTWQITIKIFIPFLIYMICCLLYFIQYVPIQEQAVWLDIQTWDATLYRLVIIVVAIKIFYEEFQQLNFYQFKYLIDLQNYLNIVSPALNIAIVFWPGNSGMKSNVSAFAVIMLWIILFLKMRLFALTGFYVKLIIQTIADLVYFLTFFCVIIMMSSTFFYITDQFYLSKQEWEYKDPPYSLLIDNLTYNAFWDNLIKSYLIALSQFDTKNFYANPIGDYIWVFYLITIFAIQIVFVNMLIAIMQDTFDKITENRQRNGLIQQTKIFSDFIRQLNEDKSIIDNKYLYILTPVLEEDQSLSWQGSTKMISKRLNYFKKEISNLDKIKLQKQKFEFQKIDQSLKLLTKNQKKSIHKIQQIQKKLSNHQHQIDQKNSKQIEIENKVKRAITDKFSGKPDNKKTIFKMNSMIDDQFSKMKPLLQSLEHNLTQKIVKKQNSIDLDPLLQKNISFQV